MHNSNTSYNELVSVHWGEDPAPKVSDISPLQWYLGMTDRPIADMLAALVLHNLFGRFPNVGAEHRERLRVAGAAARPARPSRRARPATAAGSAASSTTCPSDILKTKLSVSPFPEEDPIALADTLGLERCCSAPTGRTPKASSARSTSRTSSRRSTTTASAP